MSGQDDGVLRQCENLVTDALQFLLVVASRQVGTSYAHTEDSVACENHPSLRYVIANSAWCVSRCVQYLYGGFAQLQYGCFADGRFGFWQRAGDVYAEPFLHHVGCRLIYWYFRRVALGRKSVLFADGAKAQAMVEVHVCLQRVFQCNVVLAEEITYSCMLALCPRATIHYCTLMTDIVPDDVAVLLYGIDNETLIMKLIQPFWFQRIPPRSNR